MTAENKPIHHMEAATANALKKIAEWQANGLLKPDTRRMTHQEVGARHQGAYFDGLDATEKPDRRKPGVPLRGELEF